MGREHTLLTRLAERAEDARRGLQPTAKEDAEALMESVRLHLARLLNSRHGMCECLADYGLPAMSDLVVGSGDHIQAMRDALQTTIERYEPRLRRVRVTLDVDEDHGRALAFRVEAVLVGKAEEYKVWYETSVRGNGQFDVAG